MAAKIHIQMMDSFSIYIDDQQKEGVINKSRKGLALMEYLILNRGQSVPNYRLLATLWSEEKSSNPENALKTLVSRMRAMLNQVYPDLGSCIVADRGAYHWECLPNMTVDLYEIQDIFKELATGKLDKEESCKLYKRLIDIYTGDLLQNSEQNEWALAQGTSLHNRYMTAVYRYLEILREDENYIDIVGVCRSALEVDNFDDRLHMEMMSALVKLNRNNEALMQYKHVVHLNYRYLGVRPSDDIQEFYKQIVTTGKTLEFNLESIRKELRESGEQRGAFVCEYSVFKEIYNLQMRNLERLGSTLFLAGVMIGDVNGDVMDSLKQEKVMSEVMEIMRENLRKGDTISRFSPRIIALLLPTVNYTTGNMVMERVKKIFYRKHPNSDVTFNYRVGPISSDMRIAEKEDF